MKNVWKQDVYLFHVSGQGNRKIALASLAFIIVALVLGLVTPRMCPVLCSKQNSELCAHQVDKVWWFLSSNWCYQSSYCTHGVRRPGKPKPGRGFCMIERHRGS